MVERNGGGDGGAAGVDCCAAGGGHFGRLGPGRDPGGRQTAGRGRGTVAARHSPLPV